jgi:hypothetical protein
MNGEKPQERRREQRIYYNDSDAPTVSLHDTICPVLELSSAGLVFRANPVHYQLQQPLLAVLNLPDGAKFAVQVIVLRVNGERIFARCTLNQIPRQRIRRELMRVSGETEQDNAPVAPSKNVYERRHCDRLRYPAGASPLIFVDLDQWPVIEISTGGLIFTTSRTNFRERQMVHGYVHFPGASSIAVSGTVCRLAPEQVVVKLTTPIAPFWLKFERQRLQLLEVA